VHNWDYKPYIARSELCCLIARLDLPLGIGETEVWEEYIVRAHNPRFVKVSRQTTTRDLSKLFTERRNMLKNHVLSVVSSVALTSDIWSGNARKTSLLLLLIMSMLIGSYRKRLLVLG